VRHVSASRAAGSTRDALASRDRRDSRFGSASLRALRLSFLGTDLRAARRFREKKSETLSRFDPTASNRRGGRRAHARARPVSADSAYPFGRLRRALRSRYNRSTGLSTRGGTRDTRRSLEALARAAFPRKERHHRRKEAGCPIARGSRRVRTREDAARARPWTPPLMGRLLEGKKPPAASAGTSRVTVSYPPSPRRTRRRRRGRDEPPRRTAAKTSDKSWSRRKALSGLFCRSRRSRR
jgi:hypothetical protein